MKTVVLTAAIGILISPLPLCGQTNGPAAAVQTNSTDQQVLSALELGWADAVKRRETQKIDHIQAPEYSFIAPNGRVWTKAEALNAIKDGDLEVESFELTEMNIRIYENTAVVTFRVVWNGSFRGSDISGPQRMTDVFVKRNDRWQCVASHATNIQSP